MSVEITQVTGIRIRVYDQEVMVTAVEWTKACDVLDTIRDYTKGIDVDKVATIKLVRTTADVGLREAKLMSEAYFEPFFEDGFNRGWRK